MTAGGESARGIAWLLAVNEGTVRDRLRRRVAEATDGRANQIPAESASRFTSEPNTIQSGCPFPIVGTAGAPFENLLSSLAEVARPLRVVEPKAGPPVLPSPAAEKPVDEFEAALVAAPRERDRLNLLIPANYDPLPGSIPSEAIVQKENPGKLEGGAESPTRKCQLLCQFLRGLDLGHPKHTRVVNHAAPRPGSEATLPVASEQ